METIKKSKDFKCVYRKKILKADKLLVLYILPNELEYSRIGISVSKKVGKANVRNRIKRRLKEIFRLNEQVIVKGYDLVVVVRVSAADANFDEIKTSFMDLIKRQGLLEERD